GVLRPSVRVPMRHVGPGFLPVRWWHTVGSICANRLPPGGPGAAGRRFLADTGDPSPMTEIHDLSAADLSSAFASGELSPVEATRSLLEHVERWEPKINAMYLIHREAALAAAAGSEARWRAGSPLSAVDGVP